MSHQRLTLDDPVFAGRLRTAPRPARRAHVARRAVVPKRRLVMTELYDRTPPKLLFSDQPNHIPEQTPPHAAPLPQNYPVSTQTTQPTAPLDLVHPKHSRKEKKRVRTKAGTVMFAMAITLFMFGTAVAALGLKTNKHVEAQVTQVAKTVSTQNASTAADTPPDEQKPTAKSYSVYQVPADHPRYISIPKLRVDARVLALGTKSDDELMTPSNIYDTGWYQGSAKPGDKSGAILIDGHVHGITSPGVFMNLKKLSAGDLITIERGDGVKQTFQVVKTQSYDKDTVDMQAAMKSADPSKLGLNLITCTGTVKGNEYQQRLIVFAVQT